MSSESLWLTAGGILPSSFTCMFVMSMVGQHTVQAWVGRAVVDFLLAVETGVSRGALAEIASLWVVGTTPSVEARPVGTSHGAELAVIAVETGRTCALVGAVKVLKARKQNYYQGLLL